MKKHLLLFFLLFSTVLFAQQKTQTIKGQVYDKDTRQVISGATVLVKKSDPLIGTTTNEDGNFVLANVPLGRQTIECQFLGYQKYTSDDIIVSSAKEVVLNIFLIEEAVSMEVVEVTAIRNANEPVNELAIVSARSFSVEETERIAASVNDPGRMALSYPGVQQGGDDAENDIIIRGNSSVGILWRLEGIDIPNPNHFARPGTSGGGVTIFSAQLLSRSDFSTGAMPAEYGNAISGAYDIHFRKGNKENREYRTKIGLLGLDFATEGPVKKGQSSYLVNYRYSTLGLLNQAGFYLVGERVDNLFQDLSFNLSFDSKNKKNFITVFGLGGLSKEHYNPVENPEEREAGVGNNWEDRINGANTAVGGITYTWLPDDKSYLKWVVAGMGSDIWRDYDTLNLMDVRYRYNTEQYFDSRVSTSLTYNRKISKKARFKTGLIAHQIFFDFFRQTSPRSSSNDVTQINLLNKTSIEGKGNTQSFQYYAQLNFRPTDKLSLNAGAHFMYLALNNSNSLEPRLSMKYQLKPQHALSLAYGIHGQFLPMGTYFYTQNDTLSNGQIEQVQPNFDLKPLKSHHFVLAYNFYTKKNLRINAEVYAQRLFNVPVMTDDVSTYWMLNSRSGIPEFDLTSDGKGLNYGIDVAIEKFFSNQIYFLITASRFESMYELADGRTFNTKFATEFVSSYTLGKEFQLRNGSAIQVGARVLYNGGFRYTPHDEAESIVQGRFVAEESLSWEEQVEPYFRIDARFAWRFNREKYAGSLSLDVQNVMDRKNTNAVAYNPATNSIYFRTHGSGLIPVLSFQIDF